MITDRKTARFRAMSTVTRRRQGGLRGSLRFSRFNLITILLGMVSVGVGYAFLAGGSTVLAPLLLVLGYVVLIPIGLIR